MAIHDETRSNWIARFKPSPQARLRLLCLPFAGGATSIYRGWASALPPSVELCIAQLPGRESRWREPALTRVSPLVEALVEATKPLSDKPLALFGHSMGALVAFELARALEQTASFGPMVLIASGRRAPHLPKRSRVHDLPEEQLVEHLRRINGTPAEVLENEELMRLVLPTLRADLAVDETYEHREGLPLGCPLVALGGQVDPLAKAEALQAWRRHTRGSFRAATCPGDHFFILSHRDWVLREVSQALSGV
jgi:medium-chain acyl-[acyl-carrier-protein] hydrolase